MKPEVQNKRGIKTIFYGTSLVGKTSIILRLVENRFYEDLSCTVGVSFLNLKYNGKKYDIWDTAGQERFYSLSPMYFKGSAIEIFVFDVTDQNTLFTLKIYEKYMQDIQDRKIIVVGNKIDKLEGPNELFRIDESIKYKIGNMGMSHRVFGYVYVSAKTGDGMSELLKLIDTYADTHVVEELPPIVTFPELNTLNDNEIKDDCSC